MWWNKKQNRTKIQIKGKTLPLSPMTLAEAVDFLFALMPVIKLLKRTKEEYKSNSDPQMFRFIVNTLLTEIDKEDLYSLLAILFHVSNDEIKKFEIPDLVVYFPSLIKENNLIELFYIWKQLGAFD